MTLGDTLGEDPDVLVVVDPGELPRSYATVDILREQVGSASYRVVPTGAAGDSQASTSRARAGALLALPQGWGEAMQQAWESDLSQLGIEAALR